MKILFLNSKNCVIITTQCSKIRSTEKKKEIKFTRNWGNNSLFMSWLYIFIYTIHMTRSTFLLGQKLVIISQTITWKTLTDKDINIKLSVSQNHHNECQYLWHIPPITVISTTCNYSTISIYDSSGNSEYWMPRFRHGITTNWNIIPLVISTKCSLTSNYT